jgi:hypothetical protein
MRRAAAFIRHVAILPLYLVLGTGYAAWVWWDEWRRGYRVFDAEDRWL